MDFATITVIGVMLTPVYAILISNSKKIANVDKCTTKIKTALVMKFPNLEKVLQ